MTYTPHIFNLPTLTGLSEKQIKVHLALYEGYVKHANLILETLKGYAGYGDKASEGDKLAIAELRRRFAFEFNGMRLHELYFAQFEGRGKGLEAGSALAATASARYGEKGLEAHIREVAGSRGIGWVVVYTDPSANTPDTLGSVAGMLHTIFVNDHEVGQLAGLPILLALDLWEHAYMVDYVPAEKKNYIDTFFANLNWSVIEKRFEVAM